VLRPEIANFQHPSWGLVAHVLAVVAVASIGNSAARQDDQAKEGDIDGTDVCRRW